MSTTSITIYSDEQIQLADQGFVKAGYTLTSWNTSKDGSGTPYELNSYQQFDTDTTLYAQWRENTTYRFNRPSEAYIYPGGLTTKVYGWFSGTSRGTYPIVFHLNDESETTTALPKGVYDLFLDGAESTFHGQELDDEASFYDIYFFLQVVNADNASQRTIYGLTNTTDSINPGFNSSTCNADIWLWDNPGYGRLYLGYKYITLFGQTIQTTTFSGNHTFFRWGSKAKRITLPYNNNRVLFSIDSQYKANCLCGDMPGYIRFISPL